MAAMEEAERYRPSAPFELSRVTGMVPHKEMSGNGVQLWLIQLPQQVDPSQLSGGVMKLTQQEAGAEGDVLATFQAPNGASFQVCEEAAMFARQTFAALPLEGKRHLSKTVRSIDKRVTW
eukprot:CAMPEP_0196578734 /NCGR_PEP_ID=MMETSP1081-20130531/7584_1 /TAXON_ID=36882 /ORGANISM="Pyramimonas amylifera, Strain CCMP720" /LENGTH=119 /DNA_ID=CAMNT_0041898045 /DNA_START=128 /DNA_END=484 /DNA_ORIENTATION=+